MPTLKKAINRLAMLIDVTLSQLPKATQTSSEQSDDRGLIFAMGGLLLGLAVTLFLKLAYAGIFDTTLGAMAALGITFFCGALGALVEEHVTIH